MYYLTIIRNDSQAITRYDTANAAMAQFHHEMEYAYNADLETTCYVTDKYGRYIQQPKTYEVQKSEEIAE